jgi:uncharacterized protein YjiS (DUF1127 family)
MAKNIMTVFEATSGQSTVSCWCSRWSSELARSLIHLARALAAVQRQRRAVRELRALDQRMLADIGLGYGEIESAVRRGRSPANQTLTQRTEKMAVTVFSPDLRHINGI